jgi:hypothetical protein
MPRALLNLTPALSKIFGHHPPWSAERFALAVDMDPSLFPAEYLEQERKALGEHAFKREYLGIPVSGAATWTKSDISIRLVILWRTRVCESEECTSEPTFN